jgi:hypothetical protein
VQNLDTTQEGYVLFTLPSASPVQTLSVPFSPRVANVVNGAVVTTDHATIASNLDAAISTRATATAQSTLQTAVSDIQTDVDELQATAAGLATPASVATALAGVGLTLARMRMLDAFLNGMTVAGNAITMTSTDGHTLVWTFSPSIASPTSCVAVFT